LLGPSLGASRERAGNFGARGPWGKEGGGLRRGACLSCGAATARRPPPTMTKARSHCGRPSAGDATSLHCQSSQEGARRRVGASIRNRSVARRRWIGGRESGRAGAAFGLSGKNKEEGRAAPEPLIRRRNDTDRQFRGSRRQPRERCGEVGCRARCM
jgi:hypothetical protein